MKTFFTADLHLGHEGVLAMSARPFASIEEHDDHLIENINAVVCERDRLFILGDFCWHGAESYAKRINCKNLHLIWGNHDRPNYGKWFKTAEDVAEIKLPQSSFGQEAAEIKVFLSHYPHAYWPASHYGSLHLYGHLHGEQEETLAALFPGRRAMDVGVDQAAKLYSGVYRPFMDDEILDLLLRLPGHDPVEWYKGRQEARNKGKAQEVAKNLARQFYDNRQYEAQR